MALLTVRPITIAGIELVLDPASAGGDTFANNGTIFIAARNDSGSVITVTPTVTSGLTTGETITAVPADIPAGKTHVFGPYTANVYNDAQQVVEITYTTEVLLAVGAFSLPTAGLAGVSVGT